MLCVMLSACLGFTYILYLILFISFVIFKLIFYSISTSWSNFKSYLQSNDDSCLAYTLAAICNLLSEIGISSTTGIIGSPHLLGTSTGLGTPLSAQQQLLVLLKRSLKRANNLKLICLLAFNHLALAKFDLKARHKYFQLLLTFLLMSIVNASYLSASFNHV